MAAMGVFIEPLWPLREQHVGHPYSKAGRAMHHQA